MLLSFRMRNFRSFADEAVLSMRPVKAYGEHEDNLIKRDGFSVLKVAAIYGPNASGKSNVIKGIGTMRRLLLQSARRNSVDKLDVEPFELNAETRTEPTLFEVSLLLSGKSYRYGFVATTEAIVAEWLGVSLGGSRSVERMLFIREGSQLKERQLRYLPELEHFELSTLLPNTLLLSRLDQLNCSIAKMVMKWFSNLSVLSGSNSERYGGYSSAHFNEPDFHSQMMEFVRFADSSIEDVSIKSHALTWDELPLAVRDRFQTSRERFRAVGTEVLVTRSDRQGNAIPFDMEEKESEGTAKMFALSGPLTDILNKGRVLVIDEMEAKLHPLLTRKIVRVFNSPGMNPFDAQLLFVTHDATLLKLGNLRRDQIWFCEKNDFCESTLYCLAEIRSTAKARREDNLEKKYLEGRFGAIPRFNREDA